MADTGPKSLGEMLFSPGPADIITCKSGAAIAKGLLVKLSVAMGADSNPTVIITAATGDVAYGVALKAALAAGEYIPVLKVGWVKLSAGAAITLGAILKATSAGQAMVAAAAGLEACGVAETTAAAINDTFMARVDCF